MTRRKESLDEHIDRVAAAMTTVPADAGLAARLEPCLERRPSRTAGWLGLAGGRWPTVAIATAGAIFAAVIGRDALMRQGAGAPERPDPVAAVERAASPKTTEPATVSAQSSRLPATQPRRRPVAEVIEPAVTPIAALIAPESLNVDDLSFTSLTIAPVEFGHLGLASLKVRELDTSSEPKEQ